LDVKKGHGSSVAFLYVFHRSSNRQVYEDLFFIGGLMITERGNETIISQRWKICYHHGVHFFCSLWSAAHMLSMRIYTINVKSSLQFVPKV
jgi:hypothetical protein